MFKNVHPKGSKYEKKLLKGVNILNCSENLATQNDSLWINDLLLIQSIDIEIDGDTEWDSRKYTAS